MEDHKHLLRCRGIWKGLSFGTGNLSAIIYRQKHWLSAKAEAGFELQDLASSPNPAINSFSDTERVAFTGPWFRYLTNEKFESKSDHGLLRFDLVLSRVSHLHTVLHRARSQTDW